MSESCRVNLHYLYSEGNIDIYINSVIKYKLGGFKKDEHANDYKFLLNNKFGVGRNSFNVLYSGAIDSAGKRPLDYFFDKSKQPAPETKDDRTDVFDEIMPIMLSEKNCKAKILFPYSITNIQWHIGEIVIDKNEDNVSVVIYNHNPYGGGQLLKDNFSLLNTTLHKVISRSGLQVISVTRPLSPFTNGRQNTADKTSCGVIVADELVKRITGSSLTISSPYPHGAEQLRLSQLNFLQEKLGRDNLNYKLFKQQVTYAETNLEENLSISNSNYVARPTLEARLTIEDVRKKVEQVLSSKESDIIKIDQLKKLESAQYKPLIQQLVYKKSEEELKDLLIVLKDLGFVTIKLGELSGELKFYTDASIFYQYVITILDERLNEKLISLENKHEFIKHQNLDPHQQLTHIQQLIFSAIGGNPEKMQVVQKEVQTNKSILLALRSNVDETMQKVEEFYEKSKTDNQEDKEKYQKLYVSSASALFEYIASEMKKFLSKLYSDSEQQMSLTPPCKYSVVGLGSMALKQMTPFSDLEFAILTENEDYKQSSNPQIQAYFKNLSHLVNFKIITLGESIIPISKYGVDMEHLVHRAVNFDLGGKTPLGRIDNDKPYELIKTVEWMMHYVRNEGDKASHIDKNLPYILQNVCYVYGEKMLINDYEKKVSEFLHKKIEDKIYGTLKICQIRAIKLLTEEANEIDYSKFSLLSIPAKSNPKKSLNQPKGDLDALQPNLFKSEGRLFEVKKDIYRLPDRLVYNLGLYYGINNGSCWDTVDTLKSKGIITLKAAVNLKIAITFATILRLKTYSYHKAQQEDMSIFVRPAETESENTELAKQIFHLPEKDLKVNGKLFEYFYTALPLHEKLEKFCDKHKIFNYLTKSFFQDSEFYADDFATKGFIHYRLAQYEIAQSNLELALNDPNNKDNLQVRLILGHIYRNFGKCDQAIEKYEYCLKVHKTIYQNQPHHSVANSLNDLGAAFYVKGDYDQAIKYYEESLEMNKRIYQDQSLPSVAISLNNISVVYYAKGHYNKAIKNYEKSLEIYKLNYKEEPNLHVADFLNNLGSAYYAIGNYDQAIKHQEETLKIYKLIYKEEPHSNVADSLNNLAISYHNIGQHDQAIKYYKASLKMKQLIYQNQPHPNIADTINNIGLAYQNKGKHDQAIEYFEISLKMKRLIYQNQPQPNVADSLNNLGLAYHAKGQYDEAIKYYKEGLQVYNLIYKMTPHPSVADSLNNLGISYQNKGQYDLAIKFFKKSLKISKFVYKEKPHASVANYLNSLGSAYQNKSKYDYAIECYEESLELKKLIYQDQFHPSVAFSLNNLGSAYRAKGQHDQAIKCYEESLKIKKFIYQDQPHPSVADSANNLGAVYHAKEQYDLAIKYYAQSLEIYKLIYKEEPHPNIADVLNNLGALYSDKGQYNEAIKYHSESLKLKKHIYKEKAHPNVADSLYNLGAAYHAKEQYDQAINYYIDSLDICKLIYQEEPHSSIAASFHNLGLVYNAKGQYDLAIKYYEESLKMKNLIYRNQPHPSVADSINQLGVTYHVKGEYDRAHKCYKESLEIYKQIYKEEFHSGLADSLNNIGEIYFVKRQYDQAIKYYKESLKMKKLIYKKEPHPNVADSLINLGSVYFAKREYDQGIKCYKKSLKIKALIYEDQPHSSIANCLNNLGAVYLAKESYDEAISYFEDSLKMKELIFQDQLQPSVANSLNNLGFAYCAKGQYDYAIKYYEESLKLNKLIYQNQSHPSVGDSLNNLGLVYNAKGQYIDAIKYYSQAWKIISVFQDHAKTESITNNLINTVMLFANKYSLNPKEIALKTFYFASQEIDFSDYKVHLNFALSNDCNNKRDQQDVIDNYKLALIFLPKEQLGIKLDIYNKLAALTGEGYKNIELWQAVSEGNTGWVKELIINDGVIDSTLFANTTPLIIAIVKKDIDMVSAFVLGKADLNKPNNNQDKITPLYYSLAYNGHPIDIQIVELLLRNGADVNKLVSNNDAPIHLAHRIGHKEAVGLLLQYGANILAQNSEGKTPLHCLLESTSVSNIAKSEILQEFYYMCENITFKDKVGNIVVNDAKKYCSDELLSFITNGNYGNKT
ncbi:uncharacterized protein LOC136091183 isoform X2 [Hydra vulgaris]